MNSEKFAELLEISEGAGIDFKLEMYNFSGLNSKEKNVKRAKFVKDVVAFANTPKDGSAYIILGVKRHPDGRMEKKGISLHVDDNIFQQAIESWVEPIPQFAYHEISYEGLQFGVIEIFPVRSNGRPHMAIMDSHKTEGILRPRVLYCRRGSKNVEASGDEARDIYAWFRQDAMSAAAPVFSQGWKDFLAYSNLDELEQKFVLFLDIDKQSEDCKVGALAGIDWTFVADFDQSGISTGIFRKVRPLLEERRAVYVVSKGDAVSGNVERSTHWYFAKGMEEKASSLVGGKWQDWLKGYAADFNSKLRRTGEAISGPVVAIAIWNNTSAEPYLRRCFENVTEIFGDSASLVLVTDKENSFEEISEECGVDVVSMNFRHFFDGLDAYIKKRLNGPNDVILIPGVDGIEKNVRPSEYVWLEEDLELLHLGLGQSLVGVADTGRAFLRGGAITWFDLAMREDVERDETNELCGLVRESLQKRQAARVNLFHLPGAGGSTVGNRVAWDLHREFPVAVLRRCDPKATIERISKLFLYSEKPILLLREGNLIADEAAEELFNLLKGRQIPAVLFQIMRRYELPPRRERSPILNSKLSPIEAHRFCEKLSKDVPSKRGELNGLCLKDTETRTPFIFGLTAYQENFSGITSYVRNHLFQLTELHTKVALFLSIAYKYGHSAVHKANFATLLGLPPSKKVDFNKIISAAGRGLLVEENGRYWRPAHHLLAAEIIKQVLSAGASDERIWKNRLADIGIEFANFCKSDREVQSDELQTLVERVFIYRGDSDVASQGSSGDAFSAFASDIPNKEAKLRLFQELVKIYPEHSHMLAHLGRFYSIGLQRLESALESIDKAIELSPNDNVLHHMKGMALRYAVYLDLDDKSKDVVVIVENAKSASAAFASARRLNSQDEHGYVSEVQLIIRLLDRLAIRLSKTPAQVTTESGDAWLRESFQQTEGLLFELRELHKGENPSHHEEICRGDLDRLYGEHEKALQRWQNLIDARDGGGQPLVYAPPIRRQIVWSYLARAGHSWSKMRSKDLERSVSLLMMNIEEEPADDKSIRLWLQCARHAILVPSVDTAMEKVSYWRGSKPSLDATYYSYVLYAIDILKGSRVNIEVTNKYIEEAKSIARFRRDSKVSFEWIGNMDGLAGLVHQSDMGDWDDGFGFWKNHSKLKRIKGIVVSLSGPHAGEIELFGGLRAFFVPGTTDVITGRDLNVAVTCFIGFSYEGLRAWSVKRE